MSTERLSDERLEEIAVFAAALPNSMAYVYGCFEDVLAELERLRKIEAAATEWATADAAAATAREAWLLALGVHGKVEVAEVAHLHADFITAAAALRPARAELERVARSLVRADDGGTQ